MAAKTKCLGLTIHGEPCRKNAAVNDGYCAYHSKLSKAEEVITAVTADIEPITSIPPSFYGTTIDAEGDYRMKKELKYAPFRYINFLERRYDQEELTKGRADPKFDRITSITFPFVRLADTEMTIDFSKPVSEAYAISEAEEFLSQPVTKDFFEKHKKNSFFDRNTFDSVKDYLTLGDMMTDLRFLEMVSEYKPGKIRLVLGS